VFEVTTMPITTDLTKRLELRHPIVQAPMAGGGDTPKLVAAVSEAGALGSIGAAYLNPQQIAETAGTVRSMTSRPFGR
jgi:nitronate monooxygenase